jgi:hypothetical protein
MGGTWVSENAKKKNMWGILAAAYEQYQKKILHQRHPGYCCEFHLCQWQTSICHLTITFGYPEENCNLLATAEIYPANMSMFLETASALQDQDLVKKPGSQMNYHSQY